MEPNVTTESHVHKGLYEALAAAQAEMGRAIKDSNNPHFKSKYADLSSVCDACMPALSRNGIAVLQPMEDEDGKYFVKTVLYHGASNQSAECRVPLIIQKNDMQGYGSAVTYARRYGLMGMAGIAPEDDDGNAAVRAAPNGQDREAAQRAEVAQAVRLIGRETSLAGLQAYWTTISKSLAQAPEVIAAKDARKAELSAPVEDEIPYQGVA